jgi:hypothetical protein
MSAEQKVKKVHPHARACSYKDHMGFHSHWIIWDSYLEHQRLSSGKTKADAWKAAAERLPHE